MTDTAPVGFAAHIRPMFTDVDVEHMKVYDLDLSDRDDVTKHADAIFAVVTAGTMPPPKSGGVPWTQDMCATFKRWMDGGCQP